MCWVKACGVNLFLDSMWFKKVNDDYGITVDLLPCVGAGGRPGFALVETEDVCGAHVWCEWYDRPGEPGDLADVPGLDTRDVREIMEALRIGFAGLKVIDGVTIHGEEVWRSVVDLSAPQWVYLFLYPCVGRDGRPGFALTEYGVGRERILREWYEGPVDQGDLEGIPGLETRDVREILEALEIGLG